MQGCSRAMLSQPGHSWTGKGAAEGGCPCTALSAQPAWLCSWQQGEGGSSICSPDCCRGGGGKELNQKRSKMRQGVCVKPALSLWSRWAGAQAGSEVAESHLGKISVPAVPQQAASQGSSAQPRTCIAELFVEPILQVQLRGPGFYGFLGREKGDQLSRKQDVQGVWVSDTSFTCWQQLD